MRRVAAIAGGIVIALTAAIGSPWSRAQGSSTYRFDAIFDDARGLIPGQLIKIAGARAGSIDEVTITPDFKARIGMSVDARFAPFRADAHCTIRPEGLIAENYVDCDPGAWTSAPLTAGGGFPPTVAVANTTEPVNLLDLFSIFNLPTRQRFSILVNELGIGLAGNGQSANDIIRRANPALASARKVLGTLSEERAALGAVIEASDRVVGQLARRSPDVQAFISQAANVTELTAAHRGALADAIARLPGLLSAARPALRHVDAVAVTGAPLLQQIRASVPAVNRLTSDLGPFVQAVAPALAKFAPTLDIGTRTARDVRPLVAVIARYAHASLPGTISTGKLFVNLIQHGFTEAFLSTLYYMTSTLSRFDNVSHFATVELAVNSCSFYATTPTPGCSSHTGGSLQTLSNYLLK